MKHRFCITLLLTALAIFTLTGCATAEQVADQAGSAVESGIQAAGDLATGPLAATAPTRSRIRIEPIGEEKAAEIALKHAGFTKEQVTKLRVEYDYDNGRPIYEVDFHQGGYEYDYDIDATTGAIITSSYEVDD
jgi:uncharacterized membrane protein YkoI